MEKRISNKVETFIDQFKLDIKVKIENNPILDTEIKKEFVTFISDYHNLTLDKTDFTKRKRIKSDVPLYLRCTAKRANGEQCTRKKKEELCFCGTHEKNRPHGIIEINATESTKLKKLEVWLQEITGIMYYVDMYNNVYKTEDIITNKTNPCIIAKCETIDSKYKLVTN